MPPSDTKRETERLEKLEGVLDRLVFSREESDFIVARLRVRGRTDPVTIVGNLPQPHPGETLFLSGKWVFDKRFGEQFRFETAQSRVPSTVEGIERYLASTLIKGIGPEMARRMTAMFGEKTLDIIEEHPGKMRDVPGIGPVRAQKISDAFKEHRMIRDVMLFLQTHNVSSTLAFKIYKRYGPKAIEVVKENPYCLATDIRGIGFRSADQIAGSLGIDMRSPLRARAGILHVMELMEGEGHVYSPRSHLLERSRELLGVDVHMLSRVLDALIESRAVTAEEERIYSPSMAFMEGMVAQRIRKLITAPRFLPPIKVDRAIEWIEQRMGMTLSPQQRNAVASATGHNVFIITGGPGTGKTTLLRAVIEILEAKNLRVLLAAPTGRAAKRLSEATQREARTIHRLLEYSPMDRGFQRCPSRPLEAEFVIVDEVSMVDISLMHHLLGAIRPETTLVLVGDADQLPSVGPGNVLADLIQSGKVPVVRLDTVFRQAQESAIVTSAHRVNQGLLPQSERDTQTLSDFYLIEKEQPEEALRLLKEIVCRRIPERFGLNPFEDVQVLSPMHRGSLGTENLNRELREILNPDGRPIRGDRFRVGDRVMQIRNNYDKEVFNGDVGRIVSFDTESAEATVEYEGRTVVYHISEMDEIILAYAVSVHKSQGSEYKAVVIPLSTQHYLLLRRNLLYTAMTRGKRLVIIIASPKALAMAVENKIVEPRFTYLAAKI